MIIDEKFIMFPPPPPYLHSSSASSRITLARTHNPQANLTSLPAHILLQIIYHCFPQDPSLPPPSYLSPAAFSSSIYNQRKYEEQLRLYQPSKPERQRKTLYWLTTSLRLVSRQLYTACMHILRSTYLPSYQSLIRPPYTSDPFPFSLPAPFLSSGPPAYDSTPSFPNTPLSSSTLSSSTQSYSPLQTLHRETPILDRFIALKVRQDVLADESELHLDREDSFRDLFDVAQPRARLEDLVRLYGVREGVVSVPEGYGGYHDQRQGQVLGLEREREREGYAESEASSESSSSGSSSRPPSVLTHVHTHVRSSSVSKPPLPCSPTSTLPPAQAPTPSPNRRFFFSFHSKKPSTSSISSTSSPSSPSSSSPFSQPLPQTPSKEKEKSAHASQPKIHPIPFLSLSISFSPRRVGLVLNRSRTIAEVPRMGVGRERETLEVLARKLVGELKVALGGERQG